MRSLARCCSSSESRLSSQSSKRAQPPGAGISIASWISTSPLMHSKLLQHLTYKTQFLVQVGSPCIPLVLRRTVAEGLIMIRKSNRPLAMHPSVCDRAIIDEHTHPSMQRVGNFQIEPDRS